jgi:hypothetical protein
VAPALENHFATLPVSVQMFASQHEFTPANPGQSSTTSPGRPLLSKSVYLLNIH